MKNQKLQFALFGAGDFGPYFAPYINEVAELVAICDPSAQAMTEFRKKTGLRLAEFEHHERLLKEIDIDAAALTSPNHTHKEITLASARAGQHVYCAKEIG